jgi:hypothetical protein
MSNRFIELTQDIQDRIREIAYLMWESAGRQHGMAMQYWLAAEQEVVSTLQAAAGRMMPGSASPAPEEEPAAPVAPATAPAAAAPAAAVPPGPAAAPAEPKPAARRSPARSKAKT